MKRKALLISCASAAIAAGVIAPQKAHAQAFQGSITSSTNASQTSVGTGTETITVTAPTATINWAPNEAGTGTIDFLPSGNVATFQGGAGVADYTVLNRVTPDGVRAIGLNGSVLSKLDGGATGGKVWFYSPNGIVVGSTAVFDVGGLLLTVNDPTSWSATANGFTGTFSAPENTLASVSIENGAVINALQQNSYVALIAPRVEQGGTVQVNGAAAYAAGEQVTMTMNQGLFDIQVDIGTTDGNGVVHDGATGGPASTGAADHHRVYMVAVPKNEALTMLLSGNVGFDATTAGVVNGEIILSAGSDVLEADGSLAFGASSGVQSDISIGSGLYLSHLTAEADGNIFAIADESNLAFSGDVVLESMDAQGDGRVHVGAINGGDVTVGGDLWIQSNYAGGVTEALLYANSGGSVIVGGNARVVAQDDFGAIVDPVAAINADSGSIVINQAVLLGTAEPPSSFNEVPGDGHGGDINVLASNGGSVTVGSLEAHADGAGQNDVFGAGFAGSGFGGDVNIVASSAGSITVNGALFATADGYGGAALDGSTSAGFGQGGNVRVAGDGGTVTVTGQASLSANGQGGTYGGEGEPFQVFSGDGTGGWARFETTDSDSAITIGGDVITNANGFGGNGQYGGAGFGGSAGMAAFAGTIDVTGAITLNANGVGGDSVVGFGGDGGLGDGGGAYIEALGTASITGGNAFLDVNGIGGDGGDGFTDGIEVFIAAGSGGTGHGGYYDGTLGSGGAFVLADAAGALVDLGNINLAAVGTGGAGGEGFTGQAGGAGGQAFGGTVQAGSFDPGQTGATAGSASFGNVTLDASAHGGDGGLGDEGNGGAASGAGGEATGGGSYTCGEAQNFCGGAFLNAKGTVEVGDVWMGAQAWAGDGFTGGDALGGFAGMEITPGSTLTGTAEIELTVAAWGGYGNGGIGGDGTGGGAELLIDDGELSATGRVYVDSGGVGGGAGVSGSNGGIGAGGESIVEVLGGGSISADEVLVWTPGYGASGVVDGGAGIGGTGSITVSGSDAETVPNASRIVADMIGIEAFGWGGNGGSGVGGAGTGGDTTITASAGGALSFGSQLNSSAYAEGGDGLFGGGSATGGSASIIADGATMDGTGTVIISASAVGGNGSGPGNGGEATAGDNLLTATNGGHLATDGFLNLNGSATGGDSFAQGGNAGGGNSTITLDGGTVAAGSIGNYANAWGGDGLVGGSGTGGTTAITFTENGGSLSVVGQAALEAQGFGGAGIANEEGTGGDGGAGFGGTATVDVNGYATTGNLLLRTYGIGGDGGNGIDGGNAGSGVAGDATITVTAEGSLVSANITNFARGLGGDGGDGTTGFGGDGGSATGGTSYLTVVSGGTLDATSYHGSGNGPNGFDFNPQTQTFVSTGGNGGTGGSGSGLGGSGTSATGIGATIDGTATIAGDFIATTFARGGDGSIGGNAVAGDSTINIGGSLTVGGRLQASASAIGGNSNAGTGGSADAGEATITLNGTLNAGSVSVVTNAVGGNGTSGGGGADAGNSIFDVNGSATVASALLEAHGTGGNTTNGLGGEGRGGSAMMYVTAGGVGSFGDIEIGVDGFGGHSTNGQGGDAFAGSASLGSAGDLTATGEVFVSAEGEGGDGLTGGGAGHGNNAAIYSNDGGSIELGTSTNVEAEGTGGASTGIGSGTGGDGFGGYASLVANDDSSIIANNLTVNASGEGGSGFNGGDGYGGFGTSESFDGAYVEANGFDSVVTLTGVTSIESGGEGGSATGGTAGSGYGGTAELTSFSGLLEGANVTVEADGTTGDGGALSGDGEAGDVTVFAYGGAIDIDNLTLVANGFTEGGTIRINVDSFEFPGSFEAGTLTATANGGQFAGDVLVDVAAGSTADFGNATLTSNGGVPLSGEDGIELDIVGDLTAANLQLTSSDDIQINTHFGGTITVAGTLAADSAGLITMSDNGYSGPINATVVDLDGANIAFQGVVNADDILFTVDGDYAISELPFASNSLSITAGGNIGAAETVSYATSLLLNAGLNLTTVDIFTGGDLALTAGGNIGTGNLNSGQSITMNATGNIVSGDLTAGGGVAAGADGDLTVGDVISGFVPQTDVIGQAVVASGENVLLSAGGNLIAQTITSAEGITLDAGGTLTATDLEAVAAIAATSVGAMQVGNASAGQSIALSGGDVVAGNLDAGTTASIDADGGFSVGDVSADAATFTAGGLADFQGVVGAATIAVTSGDINIVDGGSVGVDGVTDLITFNAVSDGSEVILGGDGTEGAEGQYQLAEDGDITASAVVFNAVAAEGAPAPNIRVLDAEIDGSQASDGGVASVTLNTDANVFVEGQVSYADAAATDRIAINAGETIQVITDTGGIVMTDSDGDVSGILELTAHDIWVADQATLDQIAADPTFAGAEDLLSVNNGAVNPAGSIQAGGLTVTMLGSSFLVQNTGTGTEPAGLTVGGEGLSIVNNGSDPATVIIYGRQQGADGSIVTGDAFFEEVEFTGSGGFTDGSNVNGCGVSGGCGPDIPEEPPFSGGVESILGPVGLMNDPKGLASGSDEFAGDTSEEVTEEEEEEEGEEEGSGGVDAGSTLINTGPVSIDPPIDQPVTSGADVPTGTN